MFKISKGNTEFIFFEVKEKVIVYQSKNNQVKKLVEFNFDSMSTAIESLKKSHSEIAKSKNTWLLSTRIENIEKAPFNKEEMFNYAKWKIQEIIDIPLTDIYYDVLTNNDIENNFYKKYITAVIANKSHVDNILKTFSTLNIPLDAIDSRETALLDFFKKENKLINKKALSFLKIEEDRAVMCIYFDSGLAFHRTIELPLLKDFIGKENEINDEVYRLIADKLCLEIQRNIDFLDRQYGVQYFESITYSLPHNSILLNLANEISQYFNVKTIETYSDLAYKSEEGEFIPMEVLAGFERGTNNLEHINLIPKKETTTNLSNDLKKVLLVSLLTGVGITSIGSYYEVQGSSIVKLNNEAKSQQEQISKELQDIKTEISNMSSPLDKEIENLLKNKNEIIRMQSFDATTNPQAYNKIMREIAFKAKDAGVMLKHIKYDEKGLLLIGVVNKEELFTDFLNNLQKAETLKGKKLNLISIEQTEKSFEFKVSSENMGA